MPGEQNDVIYGVSHDTLSRLRFQWGELQQKGEPGRKEPAASHE